MATTFTREALLQRQAGLSEDKRRLLAERLRGTAANPTAGAETLAIPRRADPTKPVRLSFAQEQIWFLQQLEPDGATYNEATVVRLKTRYDRAAFERAFREIQRRHELLRSTFQLIDDDPVQVVAPWPTSWSLPVIDLGQLPPDEREVELARLAYDEPLRPFQLDREFPWRAMMVQVAEDDHLLLLVQHHIAYDGWSMEAFASELLALYGAYAAGRPSPLAELPIQYADFAEWERRRLQGPVLDAKLDFWRTQLVGHQNLRLQGDRPRPPLPTTNGATEWIELDGELVKTVASLAEANGATPFMAYLSVFKVLLARYSGQTDIILGTPVANRPRPELEGLIGIFLNSLVLRTDLGGDPTFREVLGRIRHTVVEAFAHQDLPVEFLVTRVPFERDPSRNPLFQVCFNWQDWRHVRMPEFALAPQTSGLDSPHVTAKFDLSVFIRVRADAEVSCGWEYNTDLFDAATIRRMARHFKALLHEVVADPDRPISHLPLLEPAERQTLLEDWNATAREYPADRCIHELFEAQVARTPEATALVFGDQNLTYADLNTRANMLAAWLRTQKVGPEVLVGVCMPRCVDMIVAVLGILKAGAAYVPLDPEYPAERLAIIREDAGLQLVLTAPVILTLSSAKEKDLGHESDARSFVVPPQDDRNPENLAYVIYTSGSTGRPKGVLVSHRNLVNYAWHARAAFGIQSDTRVLQFASLSFDTAAEEIYPCLISGGTLVLREPDMLGSVAGFLNRCAELRIEVLDLPTSYWHELVAALADGSARLPDCVRLVIIGGERALAADRALWQRQVGESVRLVNTYGPTETTIVALACDLTHAETADELSREVPIGTPVANARVYILDTRLQPVPIGVPGELFVGGAGVARGYLGQPELTAERFIDNPFAAGRMYRTGDLARWRADGQVEYLGRIDQQVKVRGFRVEPAEIETLLRTHPDVRECVVVARDNHLVAYVVPSTGVDADPEDLERYARTRLPEHMVPAVFVPLERLPVLPNGKLDRQALPALDFEVTRQREYAPPRTPTEATLAEIWSQVLGVERVGIHDNFFALGGHSLLAVRLAARVRRAFLVELPVRALFEAPTLALLAERIANLPAIDAGADLAPIPLIARGGMLPVSFAQERLFRLAETNPLDSSYNIAQTLHVEGPLDVEALRRSVDEIVRRHEVLRTRFTAVGDEVRAIVAEDSRSLLEVVDLTRFPEDERHALVEQRVRELVSRPFALESGPLLRVGVFQLDTRDWVLALCVHHICFDGASLDVLCRELSALYRGSSPLPDLPLQYADYAAWQRQRVDDERLDADLDYWRTALADTQPLKLPTDASPPDIPTSAGATSSFVLSSDITERLRQIQHEEGVTLFSLLLAAYQALLFTYSQQSDICVGVPVSTRDRDELHELIGLFLNTVLIRTSFEDNPTFRELVERVRDVTVSAMSHQALPFEALGLPQPQAVFTLHPAGRPALDLGEANLQVVQAEGQTAKFDLTLSIDDVADSIRGQVEGRTDLFSPARITRIAADYQALLEVVLANPDQRLSSLSREEIA